MMRKAIGFDVLVQPYQDGTQRGLAFERRRVVRFRPACVGGCWLRIWKRGRVLNACRRYRFEWLRMPLGGKVRGFVTPV